MGIYPTPPDSMHRYHSMSRSQLYKRPGNKFSFSKASVLRAGSQTLCRSMITRAMLLHVDSTDAQSRNWWRTWLHIKKLFSRIASSRWQHLILLMNGDQVASSQRKNGIIKIVENIAR